MKLNLGESQRIRKNTRECTEIRENPREYEKNPNNKRKSGQFIRRQERIRRNM